PSLLSSCRNASKRTALPEAVPSSRKPMRKTLPAGWASATAAHSANATPRARSPAHFGYFDIAQYRFWIADGSTLLTTGFGLSEKEFRTPFKDFSFMPFPLNPKIQNRKSKILLSSTEPIQPCAIIPENFLAAFLRDAIEF